MTVSLHAVTFDCDDALALARFWSELLGRSVDDGGNADFATIGLADENDFGPGWMFVKVPEAKSAKNRCHPDLTTDDRAAAVGRATAAGAERVGDFDEGGVRWTTLLDPEGNEFDIIDG